MISDEDIDRLTVLARLEMGREEKKIIRRDLNAILTYVAELNQVLPARRSGGPEAAVPTVGRGEARNILREDVLPSVAEKQAAELLAAAPRSESGYFKVKRVR